MIITRIIKGNREKIELTPQEISDANTEFVTNWMTNTIKDILDVEISDDLAQQLGADAYSLYCEGNGQTEYECCAQIAEEYKDQLELEAE